MICGVLFFFLRVSNAILLFCFSSSALNSVQRMFCFSGWATESLPVLWLYTTIGIHCDCQQKLLWFVRLLHGLIRVNAVSKVFCSPGFAVALSDMQRICKGALAAIMHVWFAYWSSEKCLGWFRPGPIPDKLLYISVYHHSTATASYTIEAVMGYN